MWLCEPYKQYFTIVSIISYHCCFSYCIVKNEFNGFYKNKNCSNYCSYVKIVCFACQYSHIPKTYYMAKIWLKPLQWTHEKLHETSVSLICDQLHFPSQFFAWSRSVYVLSSRFHQAGNRQKSGSYSNTLGVSLLISGHYCCLSQRSPCTIPLNCHIFPNDFPLSKEKKTLLHWHSTERQHINCSC